MKYFLPFIFLCTLLLSGCLFKVSQSEAEKMGNSVLLDYCARKSISPSLFSPVVITPSDFDYDWDLEYRTKEFVEPRHVVLVFIKGNRVVEAHSTVDE